MPKLNLTKFLDDAWEEYDERQWRKAQSRRSGRPGQSTYAALDEMLQYGEADTVVAEAAFQPTFSSSRHEREWILNYLGPFYDRRLITDVLRLVKGGKEANVYCCAAHPHTGLKLIAAKVYRPRMFRHLRNDARYRQGRPLLDDGGKDLYDERLLRAIRAGTAVGKQALHTSWIEHEFETLRRLFQAGADVPQPLDCGHNTILMEYIGEQQVPAPTLNQVRLPREQAAPLFERLLHNVERMLSCERIHGDLSAYNVLYWEGDVHLIDFPQAVDPWSHPEAWPIFTRDVERLCQYFARYELTSEPAEVARRLWSKAGLLDPITLVADVGAELQ